MKKIRCKPEEIIAECISLPTVPDGKKLKIIE